MGAAHCCSWLLIPLFTGLLIQAAFWISVVWAKSIGPGYQMGLSFNDLPLLLVFSFFIACIFVILVFPARRIDWFFRWWYGKHED
jgi:hypothetical protein